MNNRLFLILILFVSINSFGQMMHPAKWTFKSVENKNGEVELIFNVKLDKDWHMYSQFTPDGGPLPTLFTFEGNTCSQLIGKVTEPKPIQEFDSSFNVFVYTFDKEVTFKQKIKLTSNSCKITGKIEYQACLQSCIFLDTTFSIIIDNKKSVLPINKKEILGGNLRIIQNKDLQKTPSPGETNMPLTLNKIKFYEYILASNSYLKYIVR